jgi:hypothetical protein
MKPEKSNSMMVTSPEMRVTQGHSTGVMQLVERLQGRYQHWLAIEAPAERIVLANGGDEHHWHNTTAVEYAPQLRMELTFASASPSLYEEFNVPNAAFERALERVERVETVLSPQAPSKEMSQFPALQARLAFSAAQPVERVVSAPRRAVAEPAHKPPPTTTHPQLESHTLPKLEWPAAPKPSMLPEPEVARVAEQVIRAIDRRALAQRERMGRR